MTLNIPDTRQRLLEQRLRNGDDVAISEIVREFGVSVDTARRDLAALEEAGAARRVRGGAVPPRPPSAPLAEKIADGPAVSKSMARMAAMILADSRTLVIDGGTTTLGLAQELRPCRGLLVATPSPWIAVACHTRGIETLLLGGQLSGAGGIAVGGDCDLQLSALAVDVAVLGACGLDPEFGVSSDDLLEVRTKRQMAASAARTIVLAGRDKIGTRARHRTLDITSIDQLVTDAPPPVTEALRQAGLQVTHV